MNPYLHVGANPLGYIDPLGLIPVCRNILLNIDQKNYQDVIETLIWMQRFYAPGPPKPSAGPPLIPPRPPFPPVGPKPDFEWIPYDLQYLRQDIYQVSEIIRRWLSICKDVVRDACGRETEFTTSSERTEKDQKRELIDTRYLFRVTKPDAVGPDLQ